jgi:hypothetical protein
MINSALVYSHFASSSPEVRLSLDRLTKFNLAT